MTTSAKVIQAYDFTQRKTREAQDYIDSLNLSEEELVTLNQMDSGTFELETEKIYTFFFFVVKSKEGAPLAVFNSYASAHNFINELSQSIGNYHRLSGLSIHQAIHEFKI